MDTGHVIDKLKGVMERPSQVLQLVSLAVRVRYCGHEKTATMRLTMGDVHEVDWCCSCGALRRQEGAAWEIPASMEFVKGVIG